MAAINNRARIAVLAIVVAAIGVAIALLSGGSSGDGDAASRGDAPERARAGARGGSFDRDPARTAPDRDLAEALEDDGPGVPVVVEGRVLDAYSDAPLEGVDVELVAAMRGAAEYVATSGAGGRYHVELPSGRWDVRARAERMWSQPVRLVIAPTKDGAPVVHDVRVQRAGVIRGRVLRRGAGVAGAVVSIEVNDQAVRAALEQVGARTATADDAGRYELVVPPGEARLRAAASGTDGAPLVGFALVPSVAPGAERTVDITVADPATIAGRVVDASGVAVAGATVTGFSRDASGGHRFEATTDGGGAFRVSVPPGTVNLDARAAGRGSSDAATFKVAAGERKDGVTLTLGAPVTLTGVVLDPAGEPAAGVRIRAAREGSQVPATATTADDGTFAVPDAVAGRYEISATRGRQTVHRVVEIAPGTPGADVELVLAAPGGIRGTARVADGAVRGLTVTIERFVPVGVERTKSPRTKSATFGDGDFALPGLPPGRYDLLVTATDRAPARLPGVVVADGAWTDVEVDLPGGARLTGAVTAAGRPVSGARVSIDGGARVGFTDERGRFAFDAVPLGAITVSAIADGHAAAQGSVVVGADGGQVTIDLPVDGSPEVEGIGVLLEHGGGQVRVVSVRGGSPARGQVPVGATITAVDGTRVSDLHAAIARIRGPAGTEVTITLTLDGRTWDVTLVRARVRMGTARANVA